MVYLLKMVIFYSYVGLPEGTCYNSYMPRNVAAPPRQADRSSEGWTFVAPSPAPLLSREAGYDIIVLCFWGYSIKCVCVYIYICVCVNMYIYIYPSL